jgi:FixJ family two-component response regulator
VAFRGTVFSCENGLQTWGGGTAWSLAASTGGFLRQPVDRASRGVVEGYPAADTVVFVVDDDASLRQALVSLLQSVGLRVEAFGSAADFLKKGQLRDAAAACLVLDVRLPGVSGLDFQAELTKAKIQIPIIFISGFGDIPMTVRAMKAGAVEFLTKPFRDQDLLDAVQIALERDRERRSREVSVSKLRTLFDGLTPREQEVIGLVTSGLMNKQIASELGVSEITAKVHRGNIMRKMGARSLPELVRMADALGIQRPPARER